MIRTILNNEFNDRTAQELSDYEYTVLLDYIQYYGELDWNIHDLRCAVIDFVQDCYDYDEEEETYTIKDWWHFPMATTTVVDGIKIKTYRGGTTREVA